MFESFYFGSLKKASKAECVSENVLSYRRPPTVLTSTKKLPYQMMSSFYNDAHISIVHYQLMSQLKSNQVFSSYKNTKMVLFYPPLQL